MASVPAKVGSSAARETYKLNGLLCQWVDRIQRSRWPPCRSVFSAFSDGLRFVALSEHFCARTASGVVENPRLEEDMVGNITVAVSMFENRVGFHLSGVDVKAISHGSAEMISAFLAWIVQEFDASSELAAFCKGMLSSSSASPHFLFLSSNVLLHTQILLLGKSFRRM